MKKRNALVRLIILAILAGLVAVGFGLFHGYFDTGKFEIRQVVWSPSKKVALIAERFDQRAMTSYVYFLVIGDHVPSASELRHLYHSKDVPFAAASDCLTLHWEGPSKLVVACRDSSLDRGHINVQRSKSEGVDISYSNIPSNATGH